MSCVSSNFTLENNFPFKKQEKLKRKYISWVWRVGHFRKGDVSSSQTESLKIKDELTTGQELAFLFRYDEYVFLI